SVDSARRNLRRAGVLKKRSATAIVVPRGNAASSTCSILPPATSMRVPERSSPVAVSRLTRATEAMEGRASPRKPSVEIASRSSAVRSLEVAWRSKASKASSRVIPQPSSAMRIRRRPPASTSMRMRQAPASREFSRSSLTTDAGRSTTSPAAIWLATWSDRIRIRPISAIRVTQPKWSVDSDQRSSSADVGMRRELSSFGKAPGMGGRGLVLFGRAFGAGVGDGLARYVSPGRQLVRLDAGGADDLFRIDAADQKRICNQGAVAAPRHRFGTHDGGWALAGKADEFFQRVGEGLSLHVIGIAAKAGVAPRRIEGIATGVAKPTEVRQVHVVDPGPLQGETKLILAKLRIVARARNRAYIGQLPNAVRVQQRNKIIDRPRGMTDGENGERKVSMGGPFREGSRGVGCFFSFRTFVN